MLTIAGNVRFQAPREDGSLCPKDLNLQGGSVRVLAGNGGRARTVGMDPGAIAKAQTSQRQSMAGSTSALPHVLCPHG